jgi:AraC-like DNA-binding protein
MLASAVAPFTDPDAFYGAIRNAQVDGVVTARGNFRAELRRIDLHKLWMLRGEESLARILGVAIGNRAAILFATDRNTPQYVDGMELPHEKILVFGSDSVAHIRSAAGCRWGTMSLTLEDLAAAGPAIIGREVIAPSDTHCIRPQPQSMSRLLSLHEAAGHLAKTVPDILANPEVARAMEHALVYAMLACVGGGEEVDVGGTFRHHAAIMRRLEEVLEANLDGPLYVLEICKAARVSAKTLRLCCQEQLGMSPKRYLLLRRIHMARRALCRADPETTTVTEIATNYGFWELGRFSVVYRSLFGEAPSASLRRPPDDTRPRKSGSSSPWQLPDSA